MIYCLNEFKFVLFVCGIVFCYLLYIHQKGLNAFSNSGQFKCVDWFMSELSQITETIIPREVLN